MSHRHQLAVWQTMKMVVLMQRRLRGHLDGKEASHQGSVPRDFVGPPGTTSSFNIEPIGSGVWF